MNLSATEDIEKFTRLREKLLERRAALVDELHKIDEALGKRPTVTIHTPRSNRRTDSRFGIIEAFMRGHPGLTANEIGAALGLTPNKVSGVLTGLFKSCRVTRVRDRTTPRGVWRWTVAEAPSPAATAGASPEGKIDEAPAVDVGSELNR